MQGVRYFQGVTIFVKLVQEIVNPIVNLKSNWNINFVIELLQSEKADFTAFPRHPWQIVIAITFRLMMGLTIFCTNFTKIVIPGKHRSPCMPSRRTKIQWII
jgi:hypothetical protein